MRTHSRERLGNDRRVQIGMQPSLTTQQAHRLTWVFVSIGIAACAIRYVLRFPLWPDEAFLAINFARRDVDGILEPLEYHQVAPPLFLLLEMLVVRVFGFHEWSLRLVPFVCMVASFALFRRLAGRLLSGRAYVMAVAVFCVSYWFVRYSSEAKPYTTDLLFSLVLLHAFFAWQKRPANPAIFTACCVAALVSFGWSFPAVFVGSGICVAMVVTVLTGNRARLLWQPVVFGTVLIAGFIVAYVFHVSSQMTAEQSWMREYWHRAFPPLDAPVDLVIWLIGAFTGELMPYPIGGKNAGSIATFLLCLIGFVVFVRHRRHVLLLILLAPLGTAFIAAALQRYPFGAPTRCQLYMAPAICLLAGAGIDRILGKDARGLAARILLISFVMIALVSATRDAVRQAKSPTDMLIRDFARFFWGSRTESDRHFCLREDLGTSFTPKRDARQSLLASFLCNAHIYGVAQHRQGALFDPTTVGAIRVALYIVAGQDNPTARADWIRAFESSNDLILTGTITWPVPDRDYHGKLTQIDTIEVLTFRHNEHRSSEPGSGTASQVKSTP